MTRIESRSANRMRFEEPNGNRKSKSAVLQVRVSVPSQVSNRTRKLDTTRENEMEKFVDGMS